LQVVRVDEHRTLEDINIGVVPRHRPAEAKEIVLAIEERVRLLERGRAR
jgi:hypothetical protein